MTEPNQKMDFSDDVGDDSEEDLDSDDSEEDQDSDDSEEDPDLDPEDMPSTEHKQRRFSVAIHCSRCSPRRCILPAGPYISDRIGWYYENIKAGYYTDDEGNSVDVMLAFIAALQAQVYDTSRLETLLGLTKIGESKNAWRKLTGVLTHVPFGTPQCVAVYYSKSVYNDLPEELRGEVGDDDGEQAMHCANYRFHEEGEKYRTDHARNEECVRRFDGFPDVHVHRFTIPEQWQRGRPPESTPGYLYMLWYDLTEGERKALQAIEGDRNIPLEVRLVAQNFLLTKFGVSVNPPDIQGGEGRFAKYMWAFSLPVKYHYIRVENMATSENHMQETYSAYRKGWSEWFAMFEERRNIILHGDDGQGGWASMQSYTTGVYKRGDQERIFVRDKELYRWLQKSLVSRLELSDDVFCGRLHGVSTNRRGPAPNDEPEEEA